MKDKETPFFDGFDVQEDVSKNNTTENDNKFPAMEWLDQMLLRVDIFRLSQFKTEEQKATAANLTTYLESIKKKLLDAISQEKREDYEKIYNEAWKQILNFRLYLNAIARPFLKDNEFVKYLFLLCSKMEKKLYYMKPLYERSSGRKYLPKTLKAHFAKMPECARKYYAAEIKALEEL